MAHGGVQGRDEHDAEERQLGAKCRVCQSHELLPYKCTVCGHSYCEEHYGDERRHACILLAEKRHDIKDTSKLTKFKRCEYEGCARKDAVSVVCLLCRGRFCLQHRNEMDHQCRPIEGVKAQLEKESKIGQALKGNAENNAAARDRQDAKHTESSEMEALAEKRLLNEQRQLMACLKVQNTLTSAVGKSSIEKEDRIHLLVYFPLMSEIGAMYFFFSNRITVGRALDEIETQVPALRKLHAYSEGENGRFFMYAVKEQESLNLLPHTTAFRNLPVQIIAQLQKVIVELSKPIPHTWMQLVRPDLKVDVQTGAPSRRGGGERQRRLSRRASKESSKCVIQ
ncbi:AN1-type zinc finger protein 1 [Porphyridium purpureum]|uniref:AN1-type zinc finger protein 1 n=1 Tax=Porphyridium purpureum TaxID=35688 RepID=A0A5J4Z235_PORPP|nr:AN1-type zinc finger protein 1 [Porphyridium purpureum]|eukprot:POR7519..scf295_1